jgi:hypothetical protein
MTDDEEEDALDHMAHAVAGCLAPQWRGAFDHVLAHLAELLPMFVADQRVLYAMYLCGRRDQCEETANTTHVTAAAATSMLAHTLAELSDEAGISVEELEEAQKRARTQREGVH